MPWSAGNLLVDLTRAAYAWAIIAVLATEARAVTLTGLARRFHTAMGRLSEGVQRVRLRARGSAGFLEHFDEL